MIISHAHKFIFVKSYKTAGTSIEAALSEHCGGDDIVTPLGDYKFNRNEKGEWIHNSLNAGNYHQHDIALKIRNSLPEKVWSNYFKFSVTRNPWDRAVSFFSWEKRQDSSVQIRKRFFDYLGLRSDEMSAIRDQFSQYIRTRLSNNDDFYLIDDDLCVDFVVRYEHLSEDLKYVCKTIGVPELELPRLKSGIRKGEHHYSEYYNKESKALVADKHENDIQLFGYEFEYP